MDETADAFLPGSFLNNSFGGLKAIALWYAITLCILFINCLLVNALKGNITAIGVTICFVLFMIMDFSCIITVNW